MRTVRWVAGTLAALTVGFVFVGHASGMTDSSRSLSTGGAAVSRCDTDGVTVGQNLSGTNVVSVSVGGISASCAGGVLSLTVNNGTANAGGSATVPVGGGSVTITLASAVAVKDVASNDLTITGP